jgi:LmbE family N-acetylglucosaminyl deacetylase
MAVLAHPDDESLAFGGTLARYAAEGVETHVIMATRGQAGRHGHGEHPGRNAVGKIREAELRAAARELGIHALHFLDYEDGRLDQVDPTEASERIARSIRKVRPQVVLTFGPDGMYGHPDHIAISQLTSSAVALAGTAVGSAKPHMVSKLYHLAWGAEAWRLYQDTFKRLTMTVDGVERGANAWPEWAITTRVDARRHWRRVWRAVQCHRTQMTVYGPLDHVGQALHERLWGNQTFYRVFSQVNGGRETEADLFDGLRVETAEELCA